MLFSWFSRPPLLEAETRQWLFETFAWCMKHFDAQVFYQETQLVIPSNKYFPGRANSPHEMAQLIFERVKTYAGMQHWPWVLAAPESCAVDVPVKVQITGPLRGAQSAPAPDNIPALPVYYDLRQINNPEALIATYAHTLAHYLSMTAPEPPPGDTWPYATEILAIFMGFGLMFANSAFIFQGGCGSCRTVGRAAYLSEYEATYALAIFCVYKQIPPVVATKRLKKHLRGFFKRAMREIAEVESRQ